MTPAAHHLLRALYLHALAPSTANQDAVRAAGAALDTEAGRKLNAPRSPAPVDTIVAEVRADLLARSEVGIAKYGVTLDRKDLGHAQWLQHGYEEALDLACYLKRAMRDVTDDSLATAPVEPPQTPEAKPVSAVAEAMQQAERETQYLRDAAREYRARPVEPPHASEPDVAAIRIEARREALQEALAVVERVAACDGESAPDYAGAVRSLFPGAVEPPHAPTPFLRPLTPEPADAVLGRAGEALAWDGRQPPVWVEFEPGVRHPYGDDAYQMTTDGVARLFPSKEAAQRWLAAMGRVPV